MIGNRSDLIADNREQTPVCRTAKTTIILLLLAPTALASYLAYYDLAFFQPALASTRQQMQSVPSAPVPALLKQHIQSAYGQSLEFHTGTILLRQSIFTGGDGWRSFLWGKLAAFHLSRPEQVATVVSLAYMGSNRYGFAAASQALFDKPVEQLSSAESATLVALSSAPAYYESHPESLLKRRDQLLGKSENKPE